MVGEAVYNLTVAFSLATGSAAGLLSLLTWESLRDSPFGRAVFVLSVVMVVFILYHVVVIVRPSTPGFTVIFKSTLFTGVTVFIWMLVGSQRRLRATPPHREGS